MNPISPAATTTISASTTTASGALTGTGQHVEVQNETNDTAYVVLGTSSVVATTAGYPVLAGMSKVITREPNTQTYIAAILKSGTGNVYATVGVGA